jgi:hypothetical protein
MGAQAVTRDDRQPIIVADAGPLIRLAAAGLLRNMKNLNRRIVLVDRVEDEVAGDVSKPFAAEIAAWATEMGDVIERVRTVVGEGIASLRAKQRDPEEEALLKSALRNSGEQAIREFVERWSNKESSSALILYEDRKVPLLFLDAEFSVEFMTTRAFAATLQGWGINEDAVAALERIAGIYDLKPAMTGRFDGEAPPDMRELPKAETAPTITWEVKR